VPPPVCFSFPTFLQLLQGVLPDGFQQPVAHPSLVAPFGHDQRLLCQSVEKVQDFSFLDTFIRPHRFRCLQSPSTREDRKPSEELLLILGEQLVAPVEGPLERPVPVDGRTSSAGQKLEGIS